MPGPTHSPRTTDTTSSDQQANQQGSVNGSTAGVGAQGKAHRMQNGMGNAAAQGVATATTWRGSGNLKGSPPVRNESPPNIGIEEFESVYNQRRKAADQQLVRQHANADRFMGSATTPLDNRYWFTKVYAHVTENELKSTDGRTFYYPSYVMQCVRYFDQIYQDNLEAADAGLDVEEHWARAFEVCADEDGYFGPDILDFFTFGLYRSIKSLVSSMQAHIRYDLPRAEAWVFDSYYKHMPGADIKDFEPDFMSMMDVFDRSAATMNTVIADLHHLPADVMPRSMQDLAMARWFDADMATERAVTWERAEQLKAQSKIGTDPYREGPGNTLVGDVTATDNLSNVQSLTGSVEQPYMERGFWKAAGETVGFDGTGWTDWFTDDDIRDTVATSSTATLAKLSVSKRAQMMRRCASGITPGDDEKTILTLIAISIENNDVVATIDAANAYDLLSATHGTEYTKMREIFLSHYYPYITNDVAMAYIRRCMVGKTSEWNEEMIVDIIEAKRFMNDDGELVEALELSQSQAHDLISRIGTEFEGGGYEGGLIELEQQLDWSDENRMQAIFGHAPDMAGDERARNRSRKADLKDQPLSERVAMIQRLISGNTGNADEASIVRILEASRTAGDLVTVIDRVGAIRIAEDVHGKEWHQVQDIFRQHYYARTSQSTAFFMLNTCIIGETAEWEEEMIADLLVLRNDGRQLITRLGEGEGFHAGLNKVEWQLDGSDQKRVAAVFGTSGRWW